MKQVVEKKYIIERQRPCIFEKVITIRSGEMFVGFRRREPRLNIGLLLVSDSMTICEENNWMKRLIRALPFSQRNRRQFARCV